jgi:hypothetical protein
MEQKKTSAFLRRAFGWSLGGTFVLFLLDGWHLWGFYLSPQLLWGLAGATIGELGGLITLTVKNPTQ